MVNPLITRSLEKIYRDAEIAATTDEPVLILGETGVGKEVLARYIHARSPRRAQPFLPLNCSALPSSSIESELFGHAQGAFAGASYEKRGILERASGSTVLLDEIGDLPLDVQAKLLRVIETGEMWPVGSAAYRQIDVRFVATTNSDIKARLELGQFRRDLYFRLNIFVYHLPPLRQRPQDIPLFAQALLNHRKALAPQVLELFLCYPWPGNIRELKNVITYACAKASDNQIRLEHLPSELVETCRHPAVLNGQDLRDKLECFEAEVLRQTLRLYPNPVQAAQHTRMELRTLYRRMHKYGIHVLSGESHPAS